MVQLKTYTDLTFFPREAIGRIGQIETHNGRRYWGIIYRNLAMDDSYITIIDKRDSIAHTISISDIKQLDYIIEEDETILGGDMDQNYESNDVMVSHPSHYQSESGLEVITAIEAFTSELTGIEAVDTANVIKYICRWKKKNGLQDLEKAKWYLQHLINHVKEEKEM